MALARGGYRPLKRVSIRGDALARPNVRVDRGLESVGNILQRRSGLRILWIRFLDDPRLLRQCCTGGREIASAPSLRILEEPCERSVVEFVGHIAMVPTSKCEMCAGSVLRGHADQEVRTGLDDPEHQQSDDRKEHDQGHYGDPGRPFAFADALEFVNAFRLLSGCPNRPPSIGVVGRTLVRELSWMR
jgi:hypothetical protein